MSASPHLVQEASGPSGPEDLAALGSQWLTVFGERLRLGGRLVAAEARLALSTLLLMNFLVMLAAGALLLAWGFLVLSLGQVLRLVGLDLALVLFLLCAVHFGLAWGLWAQANRMGRYLEFQGTRRLLGGDDAE